MTRLHSIVAFLFVVLAILALPATAQERMVRQPSSNRSGSMKSESRGQVRPASRITNSPRPVRSTVAPAGGQMAVDDGEIVHGHPIEDTVIDEGMIHESLGETSSCDGNCGGCSSCSSSYCSTCRSPRRFCICLPSHGWVHPEYLLWFPNGMYLPPLVTTSVPGTLRQNAGVLPNATILYGNTRNAMKGTHPGGRIRFGTWFDRFPGWGLEGEYFGLAQQTESYFNRATGGNPILARPFFNIVAGENQSELVGFPGVLDGSVSVDVTSEFNGAAARLRRSLFCSNGCAYSPFYCSSVPTSSRLDGTLGYRFYELKEGLDIRENLTSTDQTAPGSFRILDHFDTRNQFNGGEVGMLWQGRRGLWSLDGLMRVAIGNTHQTVTIRGNTSITENGVTTPYDRGILAQPTNIGVRDRDVFSMIPELGLTLGYQFTRSIRLTTGYSLIYWGNVVRPGDQVDLDVNPNLFPPPANPVTGALRPQFQFVSSDYWVQGVSFGADIRW